MHQPPTSKGSAIGHQQHSTGLLLPMSYAIACSGRHPQVMPALLGSCTMHTLPWAMYSLSSAAQAANRISLRATLCCLQLHALAYMGLTSFPTKPANPHMLASAQPAGHPWYINITTPTATLAAQTSRPYCTPPPVSDMLPGLMPSHVDVDSQNNRAWQGKYAT
jgi:hypothetical protein